MQINKGITTRSQFTFSYVLGLLVKRGIITPEQQKELLLAENRFKAIIIKNKGYVQNGIKYIRYEPSPPEIAEAAQIVYNGQKLTEDDIVKIIAEELNLPYLKIDPLKLNADIVTGVLSRPFARSHIVIPIDIKDGNISIAVHNPFDMELIENVKKITGYNTNVILASKSDILNVITEFFGFKKSVKEAEKQINEGVDISNLEQYVKLKSLNEIEYTDRHIVNAVEYILHYAFNQRASDIHIEPKRDYSQVRFRIDGVLHNIYKLPKVVHNAIVSRIKTMARMDIAEKRRPQDGRIKTSQGDNEIELRISSLPVAFGEKIVIRIFDPDVMTKELFELGFGDEELEQYSKLIESPNGMILVTGPTGSGKTTTLYSTLREIASPSVNITTIEDPIEMVYDALNQTQVQPKIDLTFANALRNILRQDPDIIMVGEIRDPETAEMAVHAALTGHLVFSTLHTNDTASTIGRMLELGVKPYLLSSVLLGVLAQRLVRVICPNCKKETFITPDQIQMLGIEVPEGQSHRLVGYYGEGCVKCRYTGYLGRTGIFELMVINDKIRKLINAQADSKEILKVARLDGMSTLRENGIKKIAQGITTVEEVLQVTI